MSRFVRCLLSVTTVVLILATVSVAQAQRSGSSLNGIWQAHEGNAVQMRAVDGRYIVTITDDAAPFEAYVITRVGSDYVALRPRLETRDARWKVIPLAACELNGR